MTEAVKKRIAEINSGIVPDGYKKTKVGIVPVEWEVCKLSKFLEVNKEKNIQLKYDKSDVFSISGEYGIVNQIEFLGRSYAGASVEPYRIVYPENIVYTKSPLKVNPYGIIKSNQTSKTGIVSTLYAVYKCKENVISKYVEYYFGLDTTLNNYLLPLVNIGSKHDMKISDENVLKGYVCFPPLAEQQKIAEILSAQDKLIELHEKKVKKLKELKKAYLQKMFPQKGSKYPEIRFKGFTDAWEQRRLSDLLILSSDRNSEGTYSQDDVLACSLGTELQKKTIFFGLRSTEDSVKNYRIVNKGDVIYTKSPIKGFPNGIIRTNKGLSGIVPSLYCVYHTVSDVNPSIIQAYFEDKTRLDNYLCPLVNIGARNNVNITDIGFLAGEIRIPKSIAEQTLIVDCIDNLTNLITLHQRKLDKEKEKKKALMQLLLTGKVRCI